MRTLKQGTSAKFGRKQVDSVHYCELSRFKHHSLIKYFMSYDDDDGKVALKWQTHSETAGGRGHQLLLIL